MSGENLYGNAQEDRTNPAAYKPEKTVQEILENIRAHRGKFRLESKFNQLMIELHDELSNLSPDFVVEYHVVVFNPQNQRRFTILETKQGPSSKKDADNKENSFGIVGKLYSQDAISEYFLVQYGYHEIEPEVYFENKPANRMIKMQDMQLGKFWADDEQKVFYWASSGKAGSSGTEERKYAIAATVFFGSDFLENSSNDPLGAITLDFNTGAKRYPNFSFREHEIQNIYRTLKRMRAIIELMISRTAMDYLRNVIKLAMGEDPNESTK